MINKTIFVNNFISDKFVAKQSSLFNSHSLHRIQVLNFFIHCSFIFWMQWNLILSLWKCLPKLMYICQRRSMRCCLSERDLCIRRFSSTFLHTFCSLSTAVWWGCATLICLESVLPSSKTNDVLIIIKKNKWSSENNIGGISII